MIRTAAVFVLVAFGLFIMPAAAGPGLLVVVIGHRLYRRGGADALVGAVLVAGAAGAFADFISYIRDSLQ